MSLKKILDGIELFSDEGEIKKIVNETLLYLKEEIKREKINADVFLGGSFAKGTLLKKDKYDVDIFVRFDWKYEDISGFLENIAKKCAGKIKGKLSKIHGSRDYFRIEKNDIIFEIVPVVRIKKPREARNVTDLSYFHVNYVKGKMSKNKKLRREIGLAKKFCAAQNVYGAESYIQGFSGYGIECLIIHYKTFEKMLRELIKVKDRIIIDPEKIYKRKDDVLFEINESKLQSPIILVDPTWKERNVLAALSRGTFNRFQESAKKFLKSPNKNFFEMNKNTGEDIKKIAKRRKADFANILIKTDRQEGDIAGTKLKKFTKLLEKEASKYFNILGSEFYYGSEKSCNFYIVGKRKKEIEILGPPISLKKYAENFKKKHKGTYTRKGKLYVKLKINFGLKDFIKDFKESQEDKIKEMSIVSVKLV